MPGHRRPWHLKGDGSSLHRLRTGCGTGERLVEPLKMGVLHRHLVVDQLLTGFPGLDRLPVLRTAFSGIELADTKGRGDSGEGGQYQFMVVMGMDPVVGDTFLGAEAPGKIEIGLAVLGAVVAAGWGGDELLIATRDRRQHRGEYLPSRLLLEDTAPLVEREQPEAGPQHHLVMIEVLITFCGRKTSNQPMDDPLFPPLVQQGDCGTLAEQLAKRHWFAGECSQL